MPDLLRSCIRDIPDFPKPGILFKDITPLLSNAEAFQRATDLIAGRFQDAGITKVLGIESRGFIFGTPIAHALGVGFVPIRKPGKLPAATLSQSYTLEYGEDTIEMHADALTNTDRVLIVDDLLATGGTAAAAASLVQQTGATIESFAFVIELSFLNGRAKLGDAPSFSLITY